MTYITLRDKPEWEEKAAAWFHSKWGVPEEAYIECMTDYLNGATEYGWYLCTDGDRIIGGLGVIENDFHDRKDLTPNVCAVYTEEAYRGKGIAGRLLNMAVDDLRSKGVRRSISLRVIRAFTSAMDGNSSAWCRETAKSTCRGCTSIGETKKSVLELGNILMVLAQKCSPKDACLTIIE